MLHTAFGKVKLEMVWTYSTNDPCIPNPNYSSYSSIKEIHEQKLITSYKLPEKLPKLRILKEYPRNILYTQGNFVPIKNKTLGRMNKK